jgi:hypothetical protein
MSLTTVIQPSQTNAIPYQNIEFDQPVVLPQENVNHTAPIVAMARPVHVVQDFFTIAALIMVFAPNPHGQFSFRRALVFSSYFSSQAAVETKANIPHRRSFSPFGHVKRELLV